MNAPDIQLPILALDFPGGAPDEMAVPREWLMTNGLGGYASGTIANCNTRRYHGLFVPTLTGKGRTVMLARLGEEVVIGERTFRLDGEEHADRTLHVGNLAHLRAFRLEGLIPTWEYEVGGARLEKRLVLVHGENTLFVSYRHLGGPRVKLRLRPFPVFRLHDAPMPRGDGFVPSVQIEGSRIQIACAAGCRPLMLRLAAADASFISKYETSPELLYRIEKARGYDHREVQVSPGYFRTHLAAGEAATLGVTAGVWEFLDRRPEEPFDQEKERERQLLRRAPKIAQQGAAARLVLAADQFVIEPFTRPGDEAWARATGQDARSVIAGYHWFTDWGRDTMISLEGLTLSTGRAPVAAAILRTFRHYVRDGLLPNLFPEGEAEGLYHTADATMWFFHAIDRYVTHTGDLELVRDFFPTLEEIVARHLAGTRHNIRADADGLLTQGEEGYQLTWMDAKVDGWVVTPRRGKPVEINALWFNALRLMADWAPRVGGDPAKYHALAERVHGAFNRRFWNEAQQCLYDVVDGDVLREDPAIRPNQIFAISPRYPVLRRDRWEPVLRKVSQELLTPVGLRSLSADHPDYKAKYDGDLRSRDAAYHQGTVWSWLIGHYVDATLKLNPDRAAARKLLLGLCEHLDHAGLGQVSEIFDASEPFRPRGCIAQAWGIAELLRAWLNTSE